MAFSKFYEKSKMVDERRRERMKEQEEYYTTPKTKKYKNKEFEQMTKGASHSLVGGSLYSKFRKRGAL